MFQYINKHLSKMNKKHLHILFYFAILGVCFYLFHSCKSSLAEGSNNDVTIEIKVDSLLSLMTLEEKIGQMSQVRHFDDISDDDITLKFIGSVIHTRCCWLASKIYNASKKGFIYQIRNSFIVWCRCCSWAKYL